MSRKFGRYKKKNVSVDVRGNMELYFAYVREKACFLPKLFSDFRIQIVHLHLLVINARYFNQLFIVHYSAKYKFGGKKFGHK